MKRIIRIFPFIALFFLSYTLPAQTYKGGVIDKTIALVGNDIITISQLETEVQMMMAQGIVSDGNLRCEILENLLIQKLFLTQARLDSLVVNLDQVEMSLNDRVNEMIMTMGGEAEIEKYFKKPMHKLKSELRDIFHEQSLTQQMQQKVMSSAPEMTPSEIEKFYKKTDKDSLPIISTQYKLSQIVLYPSKEAATLAVKEKLLELRNRIINGEKFSTLATIYSQDAAATRGGELGMAPKSLYWAAFSDAAMALKPGQISQIVETPDGFHIIQMIEKKGDMFNARHIIIKPTYTSADKNKAFKTLDSLKRKIEADSLTFSLAARAYSQDIKSAINGGYMVDENTGSTYFEKDQLKPADYYMLKDLEPGQISEPFESLDNEGRTGNTIYKIIKLEEIIPSHTANLKQDFMIVQNIANNSKQMQAIDKFIKEKQATTLIIVDEMYHKCNFDKGGWIK
ncbi:MAG: peptidylprolyl isomerase [Bacteroidales bacterium]|nr:peptidylprolyl isomerase [Bacteroidales bacterium]